jgi:hypothetical protein
MDVGVCREARMSLTELEPEPHITDTKVPVQCFITVHGSIMNLKKGNEHL